MEGKELMTLIAMIGYLVMIVAIGVFFSKKNKTSEEFYIGGRGLGPWVTAMSAGASDMSGWLLMGLPGLAYATGLADAGWTAIGLALGTYLNWKLVAVPLRHYTEISSNSITLPDYFSNRFYDEKKILMNFAALFILIFFVVYTSSGFVACGKLFESLFGFNYQVSMIASALIIVIYTAIGGFMAESAVDFVQGILMIVALTVIITIGVVAAGGIPQILASTGANTGYLSIFSSSTQDATKASSFGIIKILSGLAWGLGYVGMPHILLRFMAIRDAQELKKARNIGTTWCIVSLTMAIIIGVVGRALYPTLLTGKATESIFIVMCKTLLDKGFLPIIGGVMLCGILAAQISTSDSQLLLASASVSQNFYKGFLKPNATEKSVMWMSRLTIIGVAICAAVMALNPDSSIFEIVSFAWAGFGACFGPLVVFSLYWKRINLQGAIAGMITGGVAVFVWKMLLSPLGGVFSLYELLPAFIASSIAIIIVSKCTREPSKKIQEEFDKCRTLSKLHN